MSQGLNLLATLPGQTPPRISCLIISLFSERVQHTCYSESHFLTTFFNECPSFPQLLSFSFPNYLLDHTESHLKFHLIAHSFSDPLSYLEMLTEHKLCKRHWALWGLYRQKRIEIFSQSCPFSQWGWHEIINCTCVLGSAIMKQCRMQSDSLKVSLVWRSENVFLRMW